MQKIITLLVYCLWLTSLFAQPNIQWQKTYGGSNIDEARGIQQTSDGGYIVAGVTASVDGDIFGNHGAYDFWVLKLSAIGSIQWKKVLGGSSSEVGYAVHQANDGGYFVVGSCESNNFDLTENHGGDDGWVVKLSSAGAIEWQRSLGGSLSDFFWSVFATTDGGCVIGGSSESIDGDLTENHGSSDFWILKLNALGSIEWQKVFGGSAYELANSIKQTSDGGYIVVGETNSNEGDVSGQHGSLDFWVIKLDSIGTLQWQKTLGGESSEFAEGVQQTADGGYIVVGTTGSHNSGDVSGHSNLGFLDYWVVKLSSVGALEWQRPLGGSEPDWGRAVVVLEGGDIVVAGTTTSTDGDVIGNDGGADYWVVNMNSTGNILWQITLGGTMADNCYAIDKTTDNGLILAGYAWSTDGDLTGSANKGKSDYWIVKLSPETSPTHESPNPIGTLEIYPNPAQYSISIKIPSGAPIVHVLLTDLLGRTVLQQQLSNGRGLDISGLASGLYFVQARTEDGRIYLGKLEIL